MADDNKKPVNLTELADVLADNARTSAMSAMYYRKVVARVRFKGRVVDTIVALSSASSAGGLIVAQKAWGFSLQPVWIVLGAVASIIALLRPIWFKFDDQMDRASGFHKMWLELQEDYLELTEKLRVRGPTQDLVDRAMAMSSRFWRTQKQDEEDPDETLLAECQGRIKTMLPRSEFWNPNGSTTPALPTPGPEKAPQLPSAAPGPKALTPSTPPPAKTKASKGASAPVEPEPEQDAAEAPEQSKPEKKAP